MVIAELTVKDLQKFDPKKTICLITVSPLEVHGHHLPLGTDVFIAEKIHGCQGAGGREALYQPHAVVGAAI